MTKAEQFAAALLNSSPGPWRYSPTLQEVTASPHGYVTGSDSVANMARYLKSETEIEANANLLILAKALGPNLIAALDVLFWIARNPGCHPDNIHREAVRVMEAFK